MEFCDFKTAVIVSRGKLCDEIEQAFDIIEQDKLPTGWSFVATGISGAAGFYLEFDIEQLPTQEQLDAVKAYLESIN
ncbi:MAG: hypothetical protein C9356_11950 [Oleiphilus sp.]|nr:MAG: hypothetical protein C9356_11950 [Oleiphilus sp.]